MKTFFSASVVTAAAVIACLFLPSPAEAHTRITTDVTWGSHVRDILREKCMVCHHPGGLAPDMVDLTFYGTDTKPGAWAWRQAIEDEIIVGNMPPWKPDSRFGDFSNVRRLTQEEMDLIIAWSRGGGPQGPKRNLPVPEEFLKREWQFGTPDLLVEMTEGFTLSADEQFGRTTTTFPIEIEEDTWITAYEFFPDNPKNIFSMTAILHDPEGFEPDPLEVERQVEYDPLASEDELEQTRMREMPKGPHYIGQWILGDDPVLMPQDGGRMLRKGSTLELQIQYERPMYADWFEEIEDHSKFGLFLSKPDEEIDLLVESHRVAAEDFVVKAGESNEEVSVTFTTEENVHLIGFNPQMGPLAKDLLVRATYPDGLTKTLMWLPEFKRKWTASYQFAEPIAAPLGTTIEIVAHYDNTEDNWDNPNNPPVDVAAGDGDNDERLLAWIDYTLDDHLLVEVPFVPPVERAGGRGGMTALTNVFPTDGANADPATAPLDPKDPGIATKLLTDDDKDIYWCPMRGDFCPIKDFHGPGECDSCGMNLKPKASFFQGLDIAPDWADWTLTEDGALPVYWCPNRGREDHVLLDYSSPGRCTVCGEPLAHKAQFETVHTWTCVTAECSRKGDFFYGAGLCPECGQPVTGMGHMDHTPVHGGWQFFMADDLYHHVEGTMPEPGVVKVYFYDDWKVPLDARNFAGKLFIENEDVDTGDVTEVEYEMVVARDGDTFLTAEVPSDFPVIFYTKLWLGGEEKRYDFEFEELTIEPEIKIDPASIRLHSHQRDPVEIPATVDGILRAILQRDRALGLLIEAQDWFSLHFPAFDTKDFVSALAERQEGLDVRQRGSLRKAIGLVNRGANLLDRAGDVGDAARVGKGYAAYSEGIALLREIYPKVSL